MVNVPSLAPLSALQTYGDASARISHQGSQLAQDIAGLRGSNPPAQAGAWFQTLRPASWRGVQFFVEGGEQGFGRRQAVHDYPFRDTVWVEDLGRSARLIRVAGFIVGDDVVAQRERMIAAAETAGSGTLVHPSLGELTVSLLAPMRVRERKEHGRVFYLEFDFVEAGRRVFPVSGDSTQAKTGMTADAADAAAQSDALSGMLSSLKQGYTTVQKAVQTASTWAQMAQGAVNDATALFNLDQTLPGELGRFFVAPPSFSPLTPDTTPTALAAQVSALAASGAAARSSATSVAAAVATAASSGDPSALADAAVALAAQVVAATPNPADAIRVLAPMAAFADTDPVPGSAIGQALATVRDGASALMRRAALSAMARAMAAYTPPSATEAAVLRDRVAALLDTESVTAADNGDDQSYLALRELRAAVVADLTARGAALAPLAVFRFGASLPALALAERLYGDAGRADELVREVNPPHPAFMPREFTALAR